MKSIPFKLGLVLGLAGALAFGCSRHLEDPIPGGTGPERSISGGNEGLYEPINPVLHPPDEDQFVVELAAGVDPEVIADGLSITIVDAYEVDGEQIVLFQGNGVIEVQDFEADYNVEVNTAGVNEKVDINAGAGSLTIGFVGGWPIEGGDEGQDAFASLDLPEVHALATGDGVKIGVVDTGAQSSHPLLLGHLEPLSSGLALTSEETCNGIDDDQDGDTDEGCGHGTFVSGEIAMCAPGATIVPVRALNSDGYGSMMDVLLGIRLAVQAGCEVINLSLCLSGYSEQFSVVLEELKNQNIAVIAAAGNAGSRNPLFPGASPHLLGVAATDNTDHLMIWSGGGYRIDLGAPGVGVYSSCIDLDNGESGTGFASGTSMATPIISSAVAIVMEKRSISAVAAATHLRQNARPIIPGTATQWGCLELYGAVSAP